jgi:hypothetical protein
MNTTRKQITRKALNASLNALLDSQQNLSGSEEGNTLNVLQFLQSAIRDLSDGDYSGFLCNADLAGQFAQAARRDYYARTTR